MAVAATGGDGGVLVVVSASGKIAWSVEVGVCAPGGMVRDLPRILRAVAELLERDRGVGKEKRRRSR